MTSPKAERPLSNPASSTATLPVAPSAEMVSRLRLAVLRTSRRLRRHAALGITPSQLSVLSTVELHGPLALGELAALEGVQPPSVTRMVGALEEAGLVRRLSDPSDRRTVRVELTAEGRDATEGIRRRRDAWLAERLGRLSSEELGAIEAVLPVLEKMIECDPAPVPAPAPSGGGL
jgi:DNA-binding MarR family transcriptional regulator